MCSSCGSRDPGPGGWQNNYSQCGACASLAACPYCRLRYTEHDTVIECQNCQRWLHTHCDHLYTDDDAERASAHDYHCMFCRPLTGKLGPLPPPRTPSPEPASPPSPQMPSPPRLGEKFVLVNLWNIASKYNHLAEQTTPRNKCVCFERPMYGDLLDLFRKV